MLSPDDTASFDAVATKIGVHSFESDHPEAANFNHSVASGHVRGSSVWATGSSVRCEHHTSESPTENELAATCGTIDLFIVLPLV